MFVQMKTFGTEQQSPHFKLFALFQSLFEILIFSTVQGNSNISKSSTHLRALKIICCTKTPHKITHYNTGPFGGTHHCIQINTEQTNDIPLKRVKYIACLNVYFFFAPLVVVKSSWQHRTLMVAQHSLLEQGNGMS